MLHTTPLRGALAATSFAALAIVLLAGCGQSDADVRAAHVEEAAAAVVKKAESYVGDPWERRAREQHLAKEGPVTLGGPYLAPGSSGDCD
jgi:hypothetical protein